METYSGKFRFVRLIIMLYVILVCIFLVILFLIGFRDTYNIGSKFFFTGIVLAALGLLGMYTDKPKRSKALFDYRFRTPLRLSRDLFRECMTALVFSSLLISLTGFLLIFLSPRSKAKPTAPSVTSLKGVLEDLDPYVQEWKPDAQLYWAVVNFSKDPRRIATVYYQSPSDLQEFLILTLWPDGTVWVWVDSWDNPIDPKKLISSSEWAIDSTEAIEIFAENEAVLSCLSVSGDRDKELELERMRLEPATVIWNVRVENCHLGEEHSPINALTGEPIYKNKK